MIKVLPFPDALASWRGSAKDLADKVNEVMTTLTTSPTEEVNERLVRYYVQEGVLDAPEREGREAMFGIRQLVQAIAARFLLRDGWPLRKAAELIRVSDIDTLIAMAPGVRPQTPAEAAISRIRDRESPVNYARAPRLAHHALETAADITHRRSALTDNLRALGNESGAPERRRLLRLELAPWCHVDLDAVELRKMDEHVPEILGTALTQALQEERLKKGE